MCSRSLSIFVVVVVLTFVAGCQATEWHTVSEDEIESVTIAEAEQQPVAMVVDCPEEVDASDESQCSEVDVTDHDRLRLDVDEERYHLTPFEFILTADDEILDEDSEPVARLQEVSEAELGARDVSAGRTAVAFGVVTGSFLMAMGMISITGSIFLP